LLEVGVLVALGGERQHREGLHLLVVVGSVGAALLGRRPVPVVGCEVDVEVDAAVVGLEPLVEVALPAPEAAHDEMLGLVLLGRLEQVEVLLLG
jgi:hypothetical protein